jgi:glutamyl-tRNA synthetase
MRLAVCGGTVSPPIDATLAMLGKERSLARCERALRWARVVHSFS